MDLGEERVIRGVLVRCVNMHDAHATCRTCPMVSVDCYHGPTGRHVCVGGDLRPGDRRRLVPVAMIPELFLKGALT